MTTTEYRYVERLVEMAGNLLEDASNAILTTEPDPDQAIKLSKRVAKVCADSEALANSLSFVMSAQSARESGQTCIDDACGEGRR